MFINKRYNDVETLVEEAPSTLENPGVKLNQVKIEESVRDILVNIGEDADREGLVKTPNRVARMMEELTAGYYVDPEETINGAIFNVDYSDEMVVVKDIDFYSMCEHHMLPFFGKVHVAYIPKGKVIGLSKIPRIVATHTVRQQGITQRLPCPAGLSHRSHSFLKLRRKYKKTRQIFQKTYREF